MKYLPILPVRDKYWRELEKEVTRIFAESIYEPLLALFRKPELEIKNTGNTLIDAIAQGIIYYDDGHFIGHWNAALTKELRAIGAIYNTPSRTWSLKREFLPADIRIAQAHSDMRFDTLRRGFLRTLDDLSVRPVNYTEEMREFYKRSVGWMSDDFNKSVEAITIPPKLTEAQRNIIATEWSDNLDKYIKGWVDERILKLRGEVQANAFAGHRSSALLDMIRSDYGVSRRKAEFLARQETSLLMSKFRESRYRDIGVQKYRWSTAHDERVRHDHRDLNGKIYDWSSPPVTNRRNGARNHPGEDFNCRCVAVAIVE